LQTLQGYIFRILQQVGNLSSLTKKSRAETKPHCIYIQNKAESWEEAVLADDFLLSIQMIIT
jgi:hypothetical protein